MIPGPLDFAGARANSQAAWPGLRNNKEGLRPVDEGHEGVTAPWKSQDAAFGHGIVYYSCMLERLRARGFEILFESHAVAILDRDFPAALTELENALVDFEIPITEIIGSGGGETKGTQRLRRALNAQGWRKTNSTIFGSAPRISPS
jgi:hypothetical protein